MKDTHFYMGRIFDLASNQVTSEALHYNPADLTTHAVVTGMTGSGKTGLCISMMEEAALDGIPAIIIDPKGDLTNLLLHFPDLEPDDFAPWLDADGLRRQGKPLDEAAAETAETWRSRPGRMGHHPRPHPRPGRSRPIRHLHPRLRRRTPGQRTLLAPTRPALGRQQQNPARTNRQHRHRPARAGRLPRHRPAALARTHPALQHHRRYLEQRQTARPDRTGHQSPEPALRQTRRLPAR
jgi:hypothetical protein